MINITIIPDIMITLATFIIIKVSFDNRENGLLVNMDFITTKVFFGKFQPMDK